MKKFAKGCLIAALSMLFLGIIILVVCIIIGGTSLAGSLKNELAQHGTISNIFDHTVVTYHNGKSNIDFSNDYPTYSGKYENMQAALASEIAHLNIDLGGASCVISESSDEYFHVYTEDAHEFQYFIEDDTFYLKGFDDISFSVHTLDSHVVYLDIPKNAAFENIDIMLGAGYMKADSLSASNNMTLEVGAGEFIADSLTVNTLNLEIGAGNVEIEDALINNADVTVGFGNMTFYGTISKDLTAECGMGNMELFLADSYESHNYDIECAMGNMTLHEKTFSAIAYSDYIDHNADSTYTLECGMGNMTILFQ